MTDPIATLTGVGVRHGSLHALSRVTASLPADSVIGLLGRNGSGKSTLLRVLAGREPRHTGSVTIAGRPISALGRTPGVVHLATPTWPGTRDRTLASLIDLLARTEASFDAGRARELLAHVDIRPDASPHRLSAGTSTAAQMCLALASRAPLTLLDEPHTGLDAPSRDLLARLLIEEHEAHPRTWVIATHLIDETAPLFERVLVLRDGHLVADAETDALLAGHVLLDADPTTLAALPHLGSIGRLGGRASAVVPTASLPHGGVRTHPLTLQSLVAALTTNPEEAS